VATKIDWNKVPLYSPLRTAWNTFRDRRPDEYIFDDIGVSHPNPNHRVTLSSGTEQSILLPILNRCATDVANIPLRHVRVDENDNFQEIIMSGLHRCLNLSANLDQTAFSFIQDAVLSMFDEGSVAIVPVDTSESVDVNTTFDILTLRTGRIVEWFPRNVKVELYNDRVGEREEIILDKEKVAIIENPLYSIMNEKNSIMKRLVNKLNLLDAVDNQSGSGKLDLIIQLPYVIKSAARQRQAEKRIESIEEQMRDSKYGIAYTDGTEKVIQLNRPAENNLMDQVEYLTRMLYSQLGLSEAVFDGTAEEAEMLNYYNRTIFPILKAFAQEFKRKFLTKTALAQLQTIKYFRDPFAFVTAPALAELADKFNRNEIVSGNEFRGVIGFTPSGDPRADELRNKNIAQPDESNDSMGSEKNRRKNQNGSKI